MSKLTHSCDETMAIIERQARIADGDWTKEDEDAYLIAQSLAHSFKETSNDPLMGHLLTEALFMGTKP